MTLLQRDREKLELGREEGTRYAAKIIELHSQGMDDNSIASFLQLEKNGIISFINFHIIVYP